MHRLSAVSGFMSWSRGDGFGKMLPSLWCKPIFSNRTDYFKNFVEIPGRVS